MLFFYWSMYSMPLNQVHDLPRLNLGSQYLIRLKTGIMQFVAAGLMQPLFFLYAFVCYCYIAAALELA